VHFVIPNDISGSTVVLSVSIKLLSVALVVVVEVSVVDVVVVAAGKFHMRSLLNIADNQY